VLAHAIHFREHTMGLDQSSMKCCHQDNLNTASEVWMHESVPPEGLTYHRFNIECSIMGPSGFRDALINDSQIGLCIPTESNCYHDLEVDSFMGSKWHDSDDTGDEAKCDKRLVESLNYVPVCFDETQSFDADRSRLRYNDIGVHGIVRSWALQRPSACEEWLHSATAGRLITFIKAGRHPDDDDFSKVPAVFYIDHSLKMMSIYPSQLGQPPLLTMCLGNILAICSAADVIAFAGRFEFELSDSEIERTVLLPCDSSDPLAKFICFIVESSQAKASYVQALTTLWLENRRDQNLDL